MKWPLYIIGSSVGILIVVGLNIKFHRDGWWSQPCNPAYAPRFDQRVEEFWRIRRRDFAYRDREIADKSMSNKACAESLDSGCA